MNGADPERREQATTRRRWLNLAELVAVAGVVIAALGFWNSWSERRDARTERTQASREAAKKARFVLRGSVASDGRVVLTGDGEHALGDVAVRFPAALGVGVKDALAHEIDRDWFAGALLKATDGGADDRVGRLPVLIDYGYTDADGDHRAGGIYDLIWRTQGGLPGFGRSLAVTDVRLRRRGGTQAVLDGLWTTSTR